MRPKDRPEARRIEQALVDHAQIVPLPGIARAVRREAFVAQVIDSLHRVRYPAVVMQRPLGIRVVSPDDDLFDPLKAAIIANRNGDLDDAFWFTFLFVHFGKHRRGGWRYAREVFAGSGPRHRWGWRRVSGDVAGFREWLRDNYAHLSRPGAGFGNHRKYESLKPDSTRGTAAVVESYVRWIGPSGHHSDRFMESIEGKDPGTAFDSLYRSMNEVLGFGRTARFDYLTMVGKLGLASITPGLPYLHGATGPAAGARLLFRNDPHAAVPVVELENQIVQLDQRTRVGMQVWEDALCNWQKSPDSYRPFRG